MPMAMSMFWIMTIFLLSDIELVCKSMYKQQKETMLQKCEKASPMTKLLGELTVISIFLMGPNTEPRICNPSQDTNKSYIGTPTLDLALFFSHQNGMHSLYYED